MRARLVERQHAGVELPQLGEEVRIAHAREARFLLGLAEARHRVEALGQQPLVIAPHRVAHRRRGQKRIVAHVAGQQAIGAEGLLVEEERGAEAERLVEIRVEHLGIARDLDAQLGDEVFGDFAVRRRAVDRLRAAVADVGAAVVGELVALGVAAEVVVVVEDQDARVGPRLAEDMRGRQAADAAAHHHEIVLLARVFRCRRVLPEGGVAHRVERLERSDVRSAQAGQRRRIAAGLALREERSRSGDSDPAASAPPTPMATPFRKSRRLIGEPMPSWRSCSVMMWRL